VPDEGSYFSRFTLKFIEITAAGAATAVSGYLIAHVAGFLSPAAVTPAAIPTAVPIVVQVAPSGAPPAAAPQLRLAPERVAPERNVGSVPERPAVNAAPAAPLSKPRAADTTSTEGKPADTPGDMESVEAKVRAALAKADANQPAWHDAPPHQADVPADISSRPAAVVAQPRPADAAPAAMAAAPRAFDVAPQPVEPAPLGTVEIPSRPVAAVAPSPNRESGQETAQAIPANEQNGITTFFATLKKIPDMLREDAPVPPSEAPRPPMPVGQ
jgi:hypothetical protein